LPQLPVHIDLRNGRGQILVDGHDIASAVTGFDIESAAGDPSVLNVTLALPLLEVHADRTRVGFTHAVHEALVALGWTPPAVDG